MIPEAQHRAAEVIGRLHAEGALNAPALLVDLVAAARRAAPHLDPAGLRMRLAHAMADSARAHRAARRRARAAVVAAARDGLALRWPRIHFRHRSEQEALPRLQHRPRWQKSLRGRRRQVTELRCRLCPSKSRLSVRRRRRNLRPSSASE
jgi:hypothetical protein